MIKISSVLLGFAFSISAGAGEFTLLMRYEARVAPQKKMITTCTVRSKSATIEKTILDRGVSSTSKEEWIVELNNDEDIRTWLADAEKGTTLSGRYIPARRGDPTVSYEAENENGNYIYLSYWSETTWQRNSSEEARVMLEDTINKICRH